MVTSSERSHELEKICPRHKVQVHDNYQRLLDVIVEHVKVGVDDGEAVVVLATAEHWSFVHRSLATHFDIDRALATRQLQFFEAQALATELTAQGQVNREQFHALIDRIVEPLMAHHKSVRIYGEVVDVLARTDQIQAALRVEAYWSAYLQKRPHVSLLCGYTSRNLEGPEGSREILSHLHSPEAPSSMDRTAREDELLQRIADLELRVRKNEKLTVLGEMCAGVAHEINNPLTVIIAQSHLLRLALDQREKLGDGVFARIEQRLGSIEAATHRLHRLVRNVLTFSRQNSPTKKRYSVGAAICLAFDLVRETLARSNVEISTMLPTEEFTSEGDQDMIVQVFVNILTNAKDAIEAANKKGRRLIKVSARNRSATEIEVTFSDNGIGMDKSTLARVFEPFFTTKEVGKGTGLGMSISHGIIREHQGRIECESELGRGTEISIILPKHLGDETVKGSKPDRPVL